MKKFTTLLLTFAFLILASCTFAQEQKREKAKQLYQDGVYNPYEVLDTRIDNMRYWRKAAELGLTPVQHEVKVPLGIFKGSKIYAKSVWREDSPDVAVTDENSTQSENSVFVNPNDPDHVLQSNNSTQNPVGALYGANYFFSTDFGETWGGSIQGAGGSNSGDPATAISLSGRQYVGYISSSGGMGVSYSDDGVNWIARTASSAGSLDKNHLTIDNSETSPYEGYVYNSWVAFSGSNNEDIEFCRSTNEGVTYSSAINISSHVNAGSHNQGVNLQTGPNGEVYAVWAVYDSWPSDETAIGFARSFDGGASFEPSERIISNIRGIRTSETSKNQRVNSFPSMAVDVSGDGSIYVVWTNIGTPGINTGNDIDVYLIKSSDQGATWSSPSRVNQDAAGLGSEHYFPWITCDPETGALSVIFYDDRNVGGNKCEVFCANSFDGGETWEDFRVSDVDFTPAPIAGLAGGYMGDYLGIAAHGGKVYPVWTDNRTGTVMTYTSPYETNSLARPSDLSAVVSFETGQVDLVWEFETIATFQYFIVYRDGFQVGTTTDMVFVDNLPDYGIYKYKVTAMHDEGESSGPSATVQWGDAHIVVSPVEVIENIDLQSTSTRHITVENVGELNLTYAVSASTEPIDSRAYCTATTNVQDEYISNVQIGDINNSSSWQGGVADYTDMVTTIEVGASETLQVTNGNAWSGDRVSAWVDWNDDQEFEQNGEEEYILENVGGSGSSFVGQISVPQGTPSGEHRMRIRMTYSSTPNPCGSSSYGEVEDYTINVSGWMLVERVVDTIMPGNTDSFEIMFDSQDLEQGTYHGNVYVSSNDPDIPVVNIPVTLNVGDGFPLGINVTALPPTICAGETSVLQAGASGGTGTYTYSWTSDPAGFTSTEDSPEVSPTETTIYTVEVSDGESVLTGSVTLVVENAPEQAATPQGEASMCWGVSQSIYSTTGAAGASTYTWHIEPSSAGSISGTGMTGTVTWNDAFTGVAMISVEGNNNCGIGSQSELFNVTIRELPTIDLGDDMTICANETLLLDAGNAGATYVWSTGETTQTILIDTTGVGIGTLDVWVEVTDTYLCANTAEISIQFDDCTGISEISEQWSVEIFPNPSNGIFSIKLNTVSNKPVSMSLFNTFGKELYKMDNVSIKASKVIELDLTAQPDGIYFISLTGDGINMIRKVVIQK